MAQAGAPSEVIVKIIQRSERPRLGRSKLARSAICSASALFALLAEPVAAVSVSAGPGQVITLVGSQLVQGIDMAGGTVLFSDSPGRTSTTLVLGNASLYAGMLAYDRQFSFPGQGRVELGFRTEFQRVPNAPVNFNGQAVMLLGDPARAQSGFDIETQERGLVVQGFAANVVLANGVTITNRAWNRYVIDDQAVLQPWSSAAVGAGFRNRAEGQLEMVPTGLATVRLPILNDGRVLTRGGDLQLLGGGTHRDGAAFALHQGGQVTLGGSHTLQGRIGSGGSGSLNLLTGGALNLTTGTELVNGGTLRIDGVIKGTDALLDNFSGGTVIVNQRAEGLDVRNNGWFTLAHGATATLSSFTQFAGEVRVDGTLEARSHIDVLGTRQPGMRLIGGVLSGSGVINNDVFIGGTSGSAQFNAGSSPGHMTINGRLALMAGSQMNIEIERDNNGLLQFDQVSAQAFELDGTVHFHIPDDVSGVDLDGIDLLSLLAGCDLQSGPCGINFGSNFSAVFDARPGWAMEFGPTGLRLSGPAAVDPPIPAPLPATLPMVLLGLWLLQRQSCRSVWR